MTKYNIYRPHVSSYFSLDFTLKEQKLIESLPNCHYTQSPEKNIILLTSSNVDLLKLDPEIIEKTILIIHPNSGHENLNKEIIQKNCIPLVLGNVLRKNAVVEYILQNLFSSNSFGLSSEWDPKRTWDRKLISHMNIGIYGLGHIGKLLYEVLTPLAQNVLISDPLLGKSFSLNSEIDVLIFCHSILDDHPLVIDNHFLNKLSSNVILINPARGSHCHMDDLFSFLRKNKNAKAYFDVFPYEPYPFNKNTDPSNFFPTSHIAGVHQKLEDDLIEFEHNVIKAFSQGSLDTFKDALWK